MDTSDIEYMRIVYFYVAQSNQDSHSMLFNLAYLSLWALLLVTPELGKVLVKGWMIKEGENYNQRR